MSRNRFLNTIVPVQGLMSINLKQLMLPLQLEENGPPLLARQLMVVCTAFVGFVLLWASIADVKELARATGQVTPAGSVQLVQHFEGGIIAEILVSDGELVETGQALVRLQPAAAESDLGQLKARHAALVARLERLSAFIDGREMDPETVSHYPALRTTQIDHLESQKVQRDRKAEGLLARVEQRQADIASFKEQKKSLQAQISLLQEEASMRKTLLDKGLVSRVSYLETKRLQEQTRTQLLSIDGRLSAAHEELREAQAALAELDATLRNNAYEESAIATAELAEVNSALSKLTDRVDRLMVQAPARGIVQGLAGKNIGDVIAPGGVLLQVVPLDDELVAEVRVSPNDIGYVHVGDEAHIKITTFDAAQFGAIKGTVRQISPSTFQDERGELYYKTVIALERPYVGGGESRHAVLPGMIVNAEIVTGSKSLVRYLLKPVYRSLDVAFTER